MNDLLESNIDESKQVWNYQLLPCKNDVLSSAYAIQVIIK